MKREGGIPLSSYKITYRLLSEQAEGLAAVATRLEGLRERVLSIGRSLDDNQMMTHPRSNLQHIATSIEECGQLVRPAAELLMGVHTAYSEAEVRQVRRAEGTSAHRQDYYKNPVVIVAVDSDSGTGSTAGSTSTSADSGSGSADSGSGTVDSASTREGGERIREGLERATSHQEAGTQVDAGKVDAPAAPSETTSGGATTDGTPTGGTSTSGDVATGGGVAGDDKGTATATTPAPEATQATTSTETNGAGFGAAIAGAAAAGVAGTAAAVGIFGKKPDVEQVLPGDKQVEVPQPMAAPVSPETQQLSQMEQELEMAKQRLRQMNNPPTS